MIASASHQSILQHVDGTEQTASAIYRRLIGLEAHKNMTSKRRRERVAVAQALEDMAEIGVIEARDVPFSMRSGTKLIKRVFTQPRGDVAGAEA